MSKLIDTTDIDKILVILENMTDEVMSAKLLREFNDRSMILGKLLTNRDSKIKNEQWELLCKNAQKKLDLVITNIMDQK